MIGIDPAPSQPSVSVVVPTFNDWAACAKKLDALSGQTWRPTQVIVVDDGSEEAVCDHWLDKWNDQLDIKLITHKSNEGTNFAVKSGLSLVEGKYVFLTATNDPIEPNFLERSVRLLEAEPDAAFSFCDPGIESGKSGRSGFSLGLASDVAFFPPDRFAQTLRRRPFHISSNSILFRTSEIVSIGGYLPELKQYADIYAAYLLAFRRGAVYTPETLGYVGMHEGGAWPENVPLRERLNLQREVVKRMLAYGGDLPELVNASSFISAFGLRFVAAIGFDRDLRELVTFATCRVTLARTLWRALRMVLPFSVTYSIGRSIRLLSAKLERSS